MVEEVVVCERYSFDFDYESERRYCRRLRGITLCDLRWGL